MSYSLITKELRKRHVKNSNTMVVILGDWPIIKNQIIDLYTHALPMKSDYERVMFISDITEPAIRSYEQVTFGVKANTGWDDTYRLAAFIEPLLTGLVSKHKKIILDDGMETLDGESLRRAIYEKYIHKTIRNLLRKADYDEALLDDCLTVNA